MMHIELSNTRYGSFSLSRNEKGFAEANGATTGYAPYH